MRLPSSLKTTLLRSARFSALTLPITVKSLPKLGCFGETLAVVVESTFGAGVGVGVGVGEVVGVVVGVVPDAQTWTLTLSTYQPSTPPQPSRPMSKRNCTVSPALATLARST